MLKPIIHDEQSYIIIWSDIAVSYTLIWVVINFITFLSLPRFSPLYQTILLRLLQNFIINFTGVINPCYDAELLFQF